MDETYLLLEVENLDCKVTIKPMENDYVVYVTTPNSYFNRWDCGYAYDIDYIKEHIEEVIHSIIHPINKQLDSEAYSCHYKFKGTKLQLVAPTFNGDIYFM